MSPVFERLSPLRVGTRKPSIGAGLRPIGGLVPSVPTFFRSCPSFAAHTEGCKGSSRVPLGGVPLEGHSRSRRARFGWWACMLDTLLDARSGGRPGSVWQEGGRNLLKRKTPDRLVAKFLCAGVSGGGGYAARVRGTTSLGASLIPIEAPVPHGCKNFCKNSEQLPPGFIGEYE